MQILRPSFFSVMTCDSAFQFLCDDDGGGFDDELGEHGLVGHLVSIASGRYCSRRLFLHFSHIFINQFYRLCSFYIVFAINGL